MAEDEPLTAFTKSAVLDGSQKLLRLLAMLEWFRGTSFAGREGAECADVLSTIIRRELHEAFDPDAVW